jgi:hypothetical protein
VIKVPECDTTGSLCSQPRRQRGILEGGAVMHLAPP